MCYFSIVVGSGINICHIFLLALFCDKALTGKTPHSANVLFFKSICWGTVEGFVSADVNFLLFHLKKYSGP